MKQVRDTSGPITFASLAFLAGAIIGLGVSACSHEPTPCEGIRYVSVVR